MKKLLLFLCTILLFLSFAGTVSAVPVQWSGNYHWYEAIPAEDINWSEAEIAAASSSFMGVSGHLATITSAEENTFIFTQLAIEAKPYWLGGFQPSTALEPDDDWQWVNGEGVFWDNGPVPGMYANWAIGEPNNLTGGDEDSLGFAFFEGTGTWNDAPTTYRYGIDGGYVVEYDVPVPEPATMLLLGAGLLGLAGFRRKFRK